MTQHGFIVKNALRNKRRAALTVLSVAVSCALLVTLLTLQRELTVPPESEGASLRVIARNKVSLGQKCRVSPEAYLDRSYDGVVAEIAPEASRQKGTLQIKVQIQAPDKYLTPELSARVDFLK